MRTHPVTRVIEVPHTACKYECRRHLRSHSCILPGIFIFHIVYKHQVFSSIGVRAVVIGTLYDFFLFHYPRQQ